MTAQGGWILRNPPPIPQDSESENVEDLGMDDLSIPPNSETAPSLTIGNSTAVRFLDAAGVDAAALIGQIRMAIGVMPCDGVLSVHSDDPASQGAVPSWCRATGLRVLSEIRHDERSTTWVITRDPETRSVNLASP